jgi:DNA invertase Pin-like site-specific DNA recombinase
MSQSNSSPLRGVVYARRSKEDREAGSIEQQLAWADGLCPREHIAVAAVFTDSGKSGHATAQRTGFHDMLAFCKEEQRLGRPVDAIVTWHANRFSRADSQETGWFLWEFRKAGVDRMLTSQRWIHFERMEDRVLLGIEQDVSSHKYSVDLAEASTRGKLARARAGRWCGGRAHYGYRLTYAPDAQGRPRPDRLRIDPETAPVVRWLFAAYATGTYSLRMLTAELNARGEPTPTVRLGAKRQAALWTVPTVRNILTNEVYLGRLVWNRTHQGRFLGVVGLEIKARPNRGKRTTSRNGKADHVHAPADTHEALVDPETFDLCRRRLAEQRRNTTPRRGGTDLVLTGLLTCGHCGRRMIGRHTRGVARYLCGSYLQFGKSACAYNSLPQEPLRKAIVRKLRERFTPEVFAQCRKVLEEKSSSAVVDDADRLARRLTDVDAQLGRAARRVITEDDEALAAEYRKQALELKAERDRLAADLDAARRARETRAEPGEIIDDAMALIDALEESMEKATPAETRAILRDHIEHVELWFRHDKRGRETRCRFVRGLIWLREDSPLAFCLSTSNR